MRGDDKGKEGKVIRVYHKTGRVIVDGVNIVKKHRRARSAEEESAIIEMPAPIDASNVMLIDPKSGKPTRVRARTRRGRHEGADRREERAVDRAQPLSPVDDRHGNEDQGARKGGAKGGAKGGGKPAGRARRRQAPRRQEGGRSGGRAAIDFTKRDHAGAGLPVPAPRLKAHYEAVVRPALAEQFGLKNLHEIPTLTKIVAERAAWARRSSSPSCSTSSSRSSR